MLKKNVLIAGVTVAALSVCSGAWAAAPLIAPTVANFPASQQFYNSGSTALDNAIKDLWTLDAASGGLCAHGTIDVYYDGPTYTSSSTHQYAVTCKTAIAMTDATTGDTLAAGTNVALFKDGAGGSFEGTKPEADQATRAYLNIFDATLTCLNNGVAFDANNGGVAYFTHSTPAANAQEHANCSAGGGTVAHIPNAGFSDLNNDMFTSQAGYPGLTPLSPTELGKLTGHPLYQQEFGIAVSLNLYRVLQAAQGKTVGSDAAVDMPTLSKTTIASILMGNITDWTEVWDPSGTTLVTAAGFVNANGTAAGTLNGGVALAGLGADPENSGSVTAIFLCRRGNQSGTNGGANAYFLNNQCGAGGVAGAVAPAAMIKNSLMPAAGCNGITAGDPNENGCKWQTTCAPTAAGVNPGCHLNDVNIGTTFYPANGTGDVGACLSAHDYADAYAIGFLSGDTLYDDTSVSPAGHPTWGYGGSRDNSTKGAAATPTSARWRYIAIDDKKPNLESVASGTYDYVMDNELYWNSAALTALGAPFTNNYNAYLGYIETSLATLSVLGDIEQPQAHGTTGGILDPLNANGGTPQAIPLTAAVNTNPVSAISRATNGVQDCGAAVLETAPFLTTPSTTGFTDGKTAGKGVPAPL